MQITSPLLDRAQEFLSFSSAASLPAFSSKTSLGRIGVAGLLLGVGLGVHATLALLALCIGPAQLGMSLALLQWSVYVVFLCLFHALEFCMTAMYQPADLTYDSFVINHSKSYTLAALAGWTEFWLETWLLGEYKRWSLVIFLGLVFLVVGQCARSEAMREAGASFSHQIADQKQERHNLVTTGLYRFVRHPSYFGFFTWSVGSQLFLCNPICTVGYAAASWMFFRDRIPVEEVYLVRFFPDEYPQYRSNTPSGIPFVR